MGHANHVKQEKALTIATNAAVTNEHLSRSRLAEPELCHQGQVQPRKLYKYI